ncbi:MAG TPA: PTS fructose transporter subunit IIBC [Lachnospiraceae bacterium]|nr:PTS fructose transporter subunit IIBC [Lachnospiraceae bacterium]
MKIVGVTACPTGIAHTYMAAEKITEEATKRGFEVKIETRGSVGIENQLTAEEIRAADVVVLGVGVSVDKSMFSGKKIVEASVADVIHNTDKVIDLAVAAAADTNYPLYEEKQDDGNRQLKTEADTFLNLLKKIPKHLMTGVSYMIPFVAAGGIMIAISFMFGIEASGVEGSLPYYLNTIGGIAFSVMIPIMAAFIAYSMADRPGIAPGMVAGLIVTQLDPSPGFLGGIIGGLLAGMAAWAIKKLKMPKALAGLMPVLIIPLFSTFLVGILMYFVIAPPCAALQAAMTGWLTNMSNGSGILLGAVIGAMLAFDLGGPVNKVAYMFGVGLLAEGIFEPQAASMASGMVPSLAMALATLLNKDLYTPAERESGKTAWLLGASFIAEGAIPFAGADPLRVIPSLMVGSAVAGGMAMAFHLTLQAPHGGIFVMGLVNKPLLFLLCTAVGTVISALLVNFLKGIKYRKGQSK